MHFFTLNNITRAVGDGVVTVRLQVFRLLQSHLAPQGVALIASKKYYFGVGGGTLDLQQLVARSGDLQSAVVFSAVDGKSNIREIIEVTRVQR